MCNSLCHNIYRKNIFKINTFTTKECILAGILIAVSVISYRVIIRLLMMEKQPAEKDKKNQLQ